MRSSKASTSSLCSTSSRSVLFRTCARLLSVAVFAEPQEVCQEARCGPRSRVAPLVLHHAVIAKASEDDCKPGLANPDSPILECDLICSPPCAQPVRVLDAPQLCDDFYLNLLHWSETNTLAVGASARCENLQLNLAARCVPSAGSVCVSVGRGHRLHPLPADQRARRQLRQLSPVRSDCIHAESPAHPHACRWMPDGSHIAVGSADNSVGKQQECAVSSNPVLIRVA